MKNAINLLVSQLLICASCFSQEINAGADGGVISDFGFEYPALNINGLLEYRPQNSVFSINLNPGVVIIDNGQNIGSFPLYFKLIIGDKYQICPNIGGFYWTNQRGGWSTGLNFEIALMKRFTPYLSANYFRVYYKEYWPNHFGGGSYITASSPGLKLSIGVKFKLNKASA
jgi:hypothetical protein